VPEIWTEKTYYTTEQLFPTVLRRSEVIEIQPVILSPIDSGLAEIEEKTKQLSQLHIKFDILSKIDAVSSTNALSMALNEVVDTGQNSGVSLYREVFLTTDYLQRHPAQEEAILKLRQAIDQLVRSI
jgi:dedicator of cytokinesis protein 3